MRSLILAVIILIVLVTMVAVDSFVLNRTCHAALSEAKVLTDDASMYSSAQTLRKVDHIQAQLERRHKWFDLSFNQVSVDQTRSSLKLLKIAITNGEYYDYLCAKCNLIDHLTELCDLSRLNPIGIF